MNIRHDHSFLKGNPPSFFFMGDPLSRQREYELERRVRDGTQHDPERPPKWKPGDKYPVMGMVIGLDVGGVLGAYGGGRLFGVIGLLAGLAGGIMAGAIIGAVIGGFIRKRRGRTKNNAHKPF